MIAFSYIDLPDIPENLLTEAYNSVNDNIPLVNLPFRNYKLLQCRQNLKDYVGSFFKNPVICGIQTIVDNQGVHIDYNRTLVYNYIIDPGGDNVTTNFYVDLKKTKKIESICINPFKWHKLKVFIPHEVEGIVERRVAITVWER